VSRPVEPTPGGPDASSAPDRADSHPDYRFSLANERTFLAWVRTAIALLAAGIAVVNLPHRFASSAGRHLLGVMLVVLGIFSAVGSFARWRASQIAIARGLPLPRSRSMLVLAGGVTLIGIIALVLVLAKL
jgi:putative membrane protein